MTDNVPYIVEQMTAETESRLRAMDNGANVIDPRSNSVQWLAEPGLGRVLRLTVLGQWSIGHGHPLNGPQGRDDIPRINGFRNGAVIICLATMSGGQFRMPQIIASLEYPGDLAISGPILVGVVANDQFFDDNENYGPNPMTAHWRIE